MLLPLETQKRILGDGKVILKAEAVQLCSKLGLPIEGHKLELRARLEDWVMTNTSLGADLKRKREASEEQRKKSKIEMDYYSLAETKPDLSSKFSDFQILSVFSNFFFMKSHCMA